MLTIKKFLLALCGAAILLTQSSCLRDSVYVKISDPVTLSESWAEFHPNPYLKPDKDDQKIALELEKPFKLDFFNEGKGENKGQGILMPEGDVINPEIEVVDQYGNVFRLVYAGAREVGGNGEGGKIIYDYPYPQELPRDREYKTVRIRSPRPIKCTAIYWFCESYKDMK